jgi:hypothetical protein
MGSKRFLSFAVLLWIGLPLSAQEVSGGITGTVADVTGALIPQVNVLIKNQDTNLEIRVLTSAAGSFLVPGLPAGRYSVDFSHEGFRTESHTAVLVEANRTSTVNAKLELGAVAATVEVTATPLLNQVDNTNGYVLDSHTIAIRRWEPGVSPSWPF